MVLAPKVATIDSKIIISRRESKSVDTLCTRWVRKWPIIDQIWYLVAMLARKSSPKVKKNLSSKSYILYFLWEIKYFFSSLKNYFHSEKNFCTRVKCTFVNPCKSFHRYVNLIEAKGWKFYDQNYNKVSNLVKVIFCSQFKNTLKNGQIHKECQEMLTPS